MPNIESLRSIQSCVMGWQNRDQRKRPNFPKFFPKHRTSDYFSYRYPSTSRYRQSLMPAQIYHGVSRDSYGAELRVALASLPTDRILEFRWRFSKDKPIFSMDFLRLFLTRKYGPLDAIYQMAVNCCLVVFKNTQSAYAVGRDPNPGHPHDKLFVKRWNPSPQDDSFFKVLKHLEKAGETNTRFNEIMDRADRLNLVSQSHSFSRALSYRNIKYGPSMQAAMGGAKGLEEVFTIIKPLRKPSMKEPLIEITPTSRVRDVRTHHQFLERLSAAPIVVVKFHATWCGPCKAIAPYIDKLSVDYPQVSFLSVDVDESSETADYCDIAVLPTFQFYINSQLVDELRGAIVEDIEERLIRLKESLN